jgi:hypothetical protein
MDDVDDTVDVGVAAMYRRAGYPALPMVLCSIQVMCAEQRDREHNGQGPRGRPGQAHRREY